MDFSHKSVLLYETIDGLAIKEDGTYVDGTLGGGGHALHVCERLSDKGRLIGVDQDEAAIQAAGLRLQPYQNKVKIDIVRSNYQKIPQILKGLNVDKADGIVLDLGVSSYQLDTPERGFTYRADAPLDMRMDQRQDITAKDIINDYPEEELYRVIRDYGEEKFARNIARHICMARQEKVIETTYELNDIIKAAIPIRARSVGGHPSKRTYQAIRIELNQELTILEQSIDQLIDLLKPGGRICIITFHSLEDRIVKRIFKTNENPCTCPPNFPLCVCGKVPKGSVITRKPILPSEDELAGNRRSKSAKLRIFERA